MSEIKLYMAPGTCARVPCITLEEIGADFETIVIRFLKGEHKSPGFLELNPKGKVPALVIDGETLTENVAIALYLADRYPGSHLLPKSGNTLEYCRIVADLSYCAATLHPIVTRIRVPQFFAGEEPARTVWKLGCDAMRDHFALIDRRLEDGPWWYGDTWSIMDAYLYWIYWRVAGAGFDTDPYPRFIDHGKRMEDRPAVQRALTREADAQAILDDEGLAWKPLQFSEKN
jgi:glutathione S-transferase